MLSEHQCQGWLEGYLLTGRHGFFLLRGVYPHHRLDVQPARQVAKGVPTKSRGVAPSPLLIISLSSHVWRQDHNGFSHQDPGFIDHVVNKKAEVVRVYLPPDANAPIGNRSLPAQPKLCQCDGRRQTAGAAVVDDGRGDQALHRRSWNLGMGQQRPRRGARCRDGLLRRCADAGNSGRRRSPPPTRSRPEGPCHQRRDLMKLQPQTSIRTACRITNSTRCSPPISPSSSPSTAIRG